VASDTKKFESAVQHWELMHNQQDYSVPSSMGSLAVICSFATDVFRESSDRSKKQGIKDIRIFRKEALRLAELAHASGKTAFTILNAKPSDVKEVLQDPTVSDVCIIGHGTLSSVYLDEDSTDRYTWYNVAQDADHLKTGVFMQRCCGLASFNFPVPLGAFAVMDHRNVIAPLQQYFAPSGLLHHHNERLVPVSPSPVMSYEYIAKLRLLPLVGEDIEQTD
jgi:hypothetical protein